MKILKILSVGIIYLLLTSSPVLATSDEDFINKVINEINDDCFEKEITIKAWALANVMNKPQTVTPSPVKFILTEEEYLSLGDMLYILSKRPFGKYIETAEGPQFYGIQPQIKLEREDGEIFELPYSGYGVLICDEHSLDINDGVFYWDGEEISRSEELNVNLEDNAKATFGEYSPILETSGDNSPIEYQNDKEVSEKQNWLEKHPVLVKIILFFLGVTLTVIGFLIKHFYFKDKKKRSRKK